MSYTVVSTWELTDGSDPSVFLRNLKEHRLPALREMGSTRVTVIQTSDRTYAAISEWPDQRTRDDAMLAIKVLRKKVHTDGSRMNGEMHGHVMLEA